MGNFGKASGSALNVGKSQLKFFGSWAGRTEPLGCLAVCGGPLRVLGVEFGTGDAFRNWERRIGSVKKIKLRIWHKHIVGKKQGRE